MRASAPAAHWVAVVDMSAVDIIQFEKPGLTFDDIKCAINPVHACDLKQILFITAPSRRIDVALAFCNLDMLQWFVKAGLHDGKTSFNGSPRRWMQRENRLPLGAAFRLARVMGVPAEVLFEDFIPDGAIR